MSWFTIMVSYTPFELPTEGASASDAFDYALYDTSTGLTSTQGHEDLIVMQVIDLCIEAGREVGCAPSSSP